MTLKRDETTKIPYEKFLLQSKNGLFNDVNDGDILITRGTPIFMTESLVFQGSGKKVYFIDDGHFWFPNYKPGVNPSYFELEFDNRTYSVAQNEESCVVFGMPDKAIKAGAVKDIVHLNDIANYIVDFSKGKRRY